jgi:hypothetical protein
VAKISIHSRPPGKNVNSPNPRSNHITNVIQNTVKNTVVAGLIRRFIIVSYLYRLRTPAKIPAPTASNTNAQIAVVGIVTLANVWINSTAAIKTSKIPATYKKIERARLGERLTDFMPLHYLK